MSRLRTLVIPLFVVFAIVRCCAFEKQSDGVLFELQKHRPSDPSLMKIQVCTEDIIRVIASAGKDILRASKFDG